MLSIYFTDLSTEVYISGWAEDRIAWDQPAEGKEGGGRRRGKGGGAKRKGEEEREGQRERADICKSEKISGRSSSSTMGDPEMELTSSCLSLASLPSERFQETKLQEILRE